MKRNIILVLIILVQYSCIHAMESGDSTDSLSTIRDDSPRQPAWMEEAQRLVHELQSCSKRSSSEDEQEDEGYSINKVIVSTALEIYKKAEPCQEEKKLNPVCLQAISNKINGKAITSNKIIAASWLMLVNPEHKEYFKKRMLEWAVIEQNKEVLKYLIKKEKVTITMSNLVGSTPLMYACEAGDLAIVKLLIRNGALEGDNKKEEYNKALSVAERYNRSTIIELLNKENIKKQSQWRCFIS